MTEFRLPSPFIDLASVDAWDAWFRWRDGAAPRDASIEDTWRRMATALTAVEPANGAAARHTSCMDALASWRLLPDARLWADAGTGRITWRGHSLHAALNAAAFVTPGATMALAPLADCAALAVRVLDNAALLGGIAVPRLRVGLVGVADALALLGLGYDSDAGRAQAAAMAGALATGCLCANVQLAADRGPGATDTRAAMARPELRNASHDLQRDVTRHGLRHLRLTALTSQPRLALLANDVADAADPLRGENHVHTIAAPGGQRTIRSSGYALNLLRNRDTVPDATPDTLPNVSCSAQISMRAVLQPWMHEVITYPLLSTHQPDECARHRARQQAVLHGLGEPAWRDPATLLTG